MVVKVPKFFALKYYNYFHLSACLYCLLTVLNSLLKWNHTIKLRVVNVSTLSSNVLNAVQIVSLLWRVRKNITHDHHTSHMLVNLYYATILWWWLLNTGSAVFLFFFLWCLYNGLQQSKLVDHWHLCSFRFLFMCSITR